MLKLKAEQQALAPKLTYHTWIGLHRDPKDNSRWQWVDGTQPSYTNWDRGEPNNVGGIEACAHMRPGGRWNDLPCSWSAHYICETNVCPNNWIPLHGSCYRIFSRTLNWNAAKSACAALGSKLAMLKSKAEQQALAPKLSYHTWIGLHRDPKDNSRWQWVDGTQPSYTNWDRGEPNNVGRNEACAHMRPGGRWNDLPCSWSAHYICETSVNAKCQKLTLRNGVHVSPSHCLSSNQGYGSICSFSCSRGFQLSGPSSTQCGKGGVWSQKVNSVSCQGVCPNNWILLHGSCYRLFSRTVNWNAAKSACAALGSKLAMLKSKAEQQALAPKLTYHTWIGLHRDPKDNSRWQWVDGTQPSYTNWDRGEPNNVGRNEACAHMRPGGKWNDLPCSWSAHYICETSVFNGGRGRRELSDHMMDDVYSLVQGPLHLAREKRKGKSYSTVDKNARMAVKMSRDKSVGYAVLGVGRNDHE